MPEEEAQFNPEQEDGEPTVGDIVNACAELLGDEVREDFDGLEFEEALGYAYSLLLENSEDPDEIFTEKGIIKA